MNSIAQRLEVCSGLLISDHHMRKCKGSDYDMISKVLKVQLRKRWTALLLMVRSEVRVRPQQNHAATLPFIV